MARFWNDTLVRYGCATLVIGCGPLAIWMLIDPKANPILPGILAALSFWPGVLMLGVGSVRTLVRGHGTK